MGADLEQRIGERLDAGDLAGAATEVLRGYGPQILGYLKLVLRDENAAFDVFGQFGEDLWRGIRGFRRDCPVRAWAYGLAYHAAMRSRQEAFRRRVRRLETAEVSQIAAEVRSTLFGGRDPRLEDRLERIRSRLTPEEQTLLTLKVDRDFSWKEIARVLEAPEATLRKRFERLRRKLRALAAQEGL